MIAVSGLIRDFVRQATARINAVSFVPPKPIPVPATLLAMQQKANAARKQIKVLEQRASKAGYYLSSYGNSGPRLIDGGHAKAQAKFDAAKAERRRKVLEAENSLRLALIGQSEPATKELLLKFQRILSTL